MKKIFLFFGLLACLSLHAVAWGDMADNGVDCTVVMEKTRFDARETFPDFNLVFTNKGEKTVRLFDDFYPLKGYGPNIFIKIFKILPNGKKWVKDTAWYAPAYKFERAADSIRFITLNPGEKHEVLIKDAYSLLLYLLPVPRLVNGQRYVLEVSFMDGVAEPGIHREYVGRMDFEPKSRSPKGVFSQ